MPEATFWFSSPFREWIGQPTVTVRWDGCMTVRQLLSQLGAEHARLRAHVPAESLTQESFDNLAAVIVDGDFLALDAHVPDGATVNVFTPLAGGTTPAASRGLPARAATSNDDVRDRAAGTT